MRHADVNPTERLLRDLDTVGRMQSERPSAAARVEALVGAELAGVLRTMLVDTSPVGGLRPRRAA